ncbi:hypothetical protein ACQ4WS_23855 [Janthinobacterium sp. LB3P112]
MSVWRSARRLSLFMHGNSSYLQYILAKIAVLAWSSRDFRDFTTLRGVKFMMKISIFISSQGGARRAAGCVAAQLPDETNPRGYRFCGRFQQRGAPADPRHRSPCWPARMT